MKLHEGQPWILPRISDEEIQKRHQRLREEMEKRDLDCLVVAGTHVNYAAGSDNIRYLSNYTMYYGEGYIVFPIAGEPRMFCRSLNQKYNSEAVSSVTPQVSAYATFARDVANYIKDLKLEKGNIGIVGAEVMPTCFFLDLQQWLTKVEFQFVSEILLQMRFIKTAEELAFVEKAGEIADHCYKAILGTAKPGKKEYEVFAAVDEALYSHGASSSFILVCSGPGPVFPYCPSSHRTLEPNDTILEEISPMYGGQWIQWGRPVVIGEPDEKSKELFRVAMEVYHMIEESLKPGITYEELTDAAHNFIAERGYTWFAPATQHVGLDITEFAYMIKGTPEKIERVPRPFDKRPLEAGTVIVNQPSVVTKDHQKGTLIIDTFIVTEDGCKVVSNSPLELAQV